MSKLIAVFGVLVFLFSTVAAQEEAVDQDRKAIEKLRADYEQAYGEGDVEKFVTLWTTPSVVYFGHESADPRKWTTIAVHADVAGLYEGCRDFLGSCKLYRNEYETVHLDVRGDAGILVTRETGQRERTTGQTESWKDSHNVWLCVKIDGKWKLVGVVFNVGKLE